MSDALELRVVALWAESLREAYLLARGQRRNELQRNRYKRYDGRGIEPFSAAWGRVEACQSLCPHLEHAEAEAWLLRSGGADDADGEYRAELAGAAVAREGAAAPQGDPED